MFGYHLKEMAIHERNGYPKVAASLAAKPKITAQKSYNGTMQNNYAYLVTIILKEKS